MIQENISVKGLSSFKIGGKARYFSVANNTDELKAIIDFCEYTGVPFLVIGGGTNILFEDAALDVCLIRLSGDFSKYKINGRDIITGAGVSLAAIISGASKIEPGINIFAGLPGTVGGAIKGNAGVKIKDKNIGALDALKELSLLRGKRTCRIRRGEIEYGYRYAKLDGIILGAEFELDCFSPFQGHIVERPKVEPFPNIGCIFKNPNEELSAGLLIDKAGLKGTRVGGAMVSTVHCNFILNIDNASYRDIMELIGLIQQAVEKKFKIRLELEAKVVSNESLRANGRHL